MPFGYGKTIKSRVSVLLGKLFLKSIQLKAFSFSPSFSELLALYFFATYGFLERRKKVYVRGWGGVGGGGGGR
jgi:hypothetical protein